MSEFVFGRKFLKGINPRGCGYEKCAPDFSVNYIRPYWLLHFVISGKGTFETERGTYNVLPSQMFVVHPHRAHCYTADGKEPWEYAWVQFDADVPLPSLLERDVITLPAAMKIFSDIASMDEITAGSEEYVCGKIWELIGLLLRVEQKSDTKQNAYIEKAKAYVFENYAQPLKVSDIAKMLSLDRTYFSTVFKAETGISPKQYIANVRLEKAAELLMENCSVAETAYRVGYSDNVNFSRMFKRRFWVSPMKYKEKIALSKIEYDKALEEQEI